MKKKMLFLLAAVALLSVSCSKNDANEDEGDNGGSSNTELGLVFEATESGQKIYYIGDGDQNFEVPKGNYTLDASKQYIMRGWVYVSDGATITIPAGTVIRGDKATMAALIVERGGKLMAQGTAQRPIVFTSAQPAGSRKPGDWGGIIICGKARNNKTEQQIEGGPRTKHGGQDDADNSGILSYVRIEFAGYPFDTDKEINGLTFGSVGNQTKVDHVQVSYSNDDSFEWFGGSVNCSYLVAYHGWDDDFDTDNGFSGKMQFLLGVRHPRIADTSLSNGFESDNNADGSDENPRTNAQFSNVTLIGPMGQDAAFYNQSAYITAGSLYPNNGSKLGQFQAGVQIRRGSNISLSNALIMGYPVGMIIENDKGNGDAQGAATAGVIKARNIVFAGYDATQTSFDNTVANTNPTFGILASDANKTWKTGKSGATTDFTGSFLTAAGNGNKILTGLNSAALAQPNSMLIGFAPFPTNGSPVLDATYTVPSGMDARGNGYAGAFKDASDNWMAGWTNFDPQNTAY